MWIVHAFHALYSDGTISRQHLCTHACCLSLRVVDGICLGDRTSHRYDRGKYLTVLWWGTKCQAIDLARAYLHMIFAWIIRDVYAFIQVSKSNDHVKRECVISAIYLSLQRVYNIYIYMYILTRREAHKFVSWSKSLFLYGRSLHVNSHVSD